MRHPFTTLDVFTTDRFAGNPLAVVLDADELDTAAMQQIAREFNLSETVFVQRPADASHRAKLRIFTTAQELPFAGHPTVGTAVLLAHRSGERSERLAKVDFVLEETIGLVRCRVDLTGDVGGRAEFELPRASVKQPAIVDVAAMALAVGLTAGDCALPGLPIERWSAGNAFTLVPVRDLAAIARCRVDLARFDPVFGEGRAPGAAFLFCRETSKTGRDFHARMFAPGMGPIEDPATGSAVAAFSGYLFAHDPRPDGDRVVRIEQGFEMGRPSLIELTLRVRGGALAGASIGGDAVVVSEGRI